MLHIIVDDFIRLFSGRWCDFDGAYGNQCEDVAQFWNFVLGNPQPFTGATADLIYQQPGDFYIQIPNAPDNYPQKGDIVVWNWPHVGINTGNNTNANQFEVLEQNDPTDSNCHLKTYDYNGVIGWLRPKQLPQNQQVIIDQLRAERDKNWNLYQADEKTIANLNQIINDRNNDITMLNAKIATLETQVTTEKQQIDTLKPIAAAVPQITQERDQAINDRNNCLQAEEAQQKKIADLQAQLAASKPATLWGRIKYIFNL